MTELQQFKDFLEFGYKEYRANLTVDCAIFGYHEGSLQLLLNNNKLFTKWSLPGGYIKKTETLEETAVRITSQRTGIENLFLKQFVTLLNPGYNKTKSYDPEKLKELIGMDLPLNGWLTGENATVGYYAVSDIVNAKPQADFMSSECRWFPIDALPPLGFSHEEMVKEALSAMRLHLYHYPIGRSFLPDLFTLKEIKLFYEVMSGKTLHSSNFPNKLIACGLIRKTNEKRKIGAHRSPTFYKFDEETYNQALEEGFVFV